MFWSDLGEMGLNVYGFCLWCFRSKEEKEVKGKLGAFTFVTIRKFQIKKIKTLLLFL